MGHWLPDRGSNPGLQLSSSTLLFARSLVFVSSAHAGKFGLIFWTKHNEHFTLPQPTSAVGAVTLDLAVGMFAAFVGTLVKMPFDVAKSRLQNQSTPPAGTEPRYRHTLQCCASIWRDEGASALFKGLSPTLMRIVLGNGVAYAAFELALKATRPALAQSSTTTCNEHTHFTHNHDDRTVSRSSDDSRKGRHNIRIEKGEG